jgi:hypothetical protein
MNRKVLHSQSPGWFSLSEEAEQRLMDIGLDPETVKRHDPRLISIVEELGLERASGPYSELHIAEIYCDLYYIDSDHSGAEAVITPDDFEWIDSSKVLE